MDTFQTKQISDLLNANNRVLQEILLELKKLTNSEIESKDQS